MNFRPASSRTWDSCQGSRSRWSTTIPMTPTVELSLFAIRRSRLGPTVHYPRSGTDYLSPLRHTVKNMRCYSTRTLVRETMMLRLSVKAQSRVSLVLRVQLRKKEVPRALCIRPTMTNAVEGLLACAGRNKSSSCV